MRKTVEIQITPQGTKKGTLAQTIFVQTFDEESLIQSIIPGIKHLEEI